jgi:hypothetical protein
MERMGPRGGDLVHLGLIIAGGSSAEVDYVGSLLMGYSLSEVKHLEQYIKVNKLDLSKVEVVGERLEDVSYPFKKVNLEQVLPDELQVHTKGSCSACENAFLLSCQLLEKVPSQPVDVYIGKWLEECVTTTYRTIGFGSCCPGNLGLEKIIKGCPPYPFALRDYLQRIGVV